MEQQIISQAKWLYAYNGAYFTKEQCVKQIIKQNGNACLNGVLRLYDITLDEYVQWIVKNI